MARAFAEKDAIPNDWRIRQPGLTVWILVSVVRILLVAFFYSIYYALPSLRQSPTWTYRQAFATRLTKISMTIIREVGFTQSLSLESGELGDRWVIMNPASADCYRGAFASDTIKPEKIGATWYPNPPPKASPRLVDDDDNEDEDEDDNKSVVALSFHGSAFLWLTGRPDDSGFTADLLNSALGPGARSLWVQYRLAGGDHPTPYPGPMQDTVTAYLYLVQEMGISPSRIVLVGDSSGATMAMALLRHLASFQNQAGHELADLPPPRACLLFSPSVEYSYEGDSQAVNANRNQPTDYCDGQMAAWGARAFAPPETVQLDDPYLSPSLHPFATPVPIFAQVGGAEMLCDSVKGFADAMRAIPGNRVEYLENPGLPHDIYMIGQILGWPEQQIEMIDAAAGFVRRV
ncbi:alpha/beta-hydrolase [Aspergillus sclerotioniger CBS 115572]|uniref:Alpha/beta-hydrolase n=1 Tax=Aspergillus sclerotioniger CBS 115572 TaxID=1450535 RepID=A0A317XCH6_9EURO|nr:alpha/beta-hydrolase [Aspergillus sclerotioniger CBS 115572]PWY94658.1 alpha/beta-hydrolase [Aspergillus sclerotioniger CBS 115572]